MVVKSQLNHKYYNTIKINIQNESILNIICRLKLILHLFK